MIPDLSLLIVSAAAGRITRLDWQVIDAIYVRKLGVRSAARKLGISHSAIRRRLSRIRRLCR